MPTTRTPPPRAIDYPDSDGQPLAETPRHRKNLTNLIETLEVWFAGDPNVYVSGNMFVYYMPGDRRRHVSPDVFVVRGVAKNPTPERRSYLVWEEGKGPDLVIELTSESTREEDVDDKFAIHQKTLQVKEYFLFDPYADYLQPPLQGYRLGKGRYVRIRPVKGRLPSEVLGLHLERKDWQLRLHDPATKQQLPTPQEAREQAEANERQAQEAREQAEANERQAQEAREQAEEAQRQAEAEVTRLQRELEALRGNAPKGG